MISTALIILALCYLTSDKEINMKQLLITMFIKAFGTHPFKAKGEIKTTGISKTFVPKSFVKDFPVWDSSKFENIQYID